MQMSVYRIALFTALLLLVSWPVQAQFSGDIDITFTAAQDEITVGDLVELTLSVKHPAGYQVIFPPLPVEWEPYDVRAQHEPETVRNADGSETTSQVIEATLFAYGTHATPSMTLFIRDTDGQKLERVVPQLSLTVVPTLDPDDTELRDIKPQAVMVAPIPWAWIAGGGLLALLLAVAGWWLIRRLSKRAKPAPTPLVTPHYIDPRPPYQIALEELDRIERMDLPGQGRFKEYYSLVTDCVRHYLGGMYHVPAIDLTTTETRTALQQTWLAGEYIDRFIQLFSEGDLVKFARLVPVLADSYAAIDQARTLIHETKIIAPPTEPEAEADEPPLEVEPSAPEAA